MFKNVFNVLLLIFANKFLFNQPIFLDLLQVRLDPVIKLLGIVVAVLLILILLIFHVVIYTVSQKKLCRFVFVRT